MLLIYKKNFDIIVTAIFSKFEYVCIKNICNKEDKMLNLDYKLLLPLLIIELVLKLIGLIDLARTEKERIRGGSKLLWVILILLVSIFGTIIYFIFGKKNQENNQ